jgi:hypothetical protein
MFSLTPTQLRARRLRGGLAGYSGRSFAHGGLLGGLVGAGPCALGLDSWRHRGAAGSSLAVATRKQPMLLQGLDFGVISFATIACEGAVSNPVEGCV